MGNYYKPWQKASADPPPAPPSHPLDKIRCHGGHRRYVVACMQHCTERTYCKEFWEFFERVGVSPKEYYNQGGIGDRVMRRIVIDCDRCGKKDLERVYSQYRPEGEGEEYRLPEEERRAMVEQLGFAWDDLGPVLFHTLGQLETGRTWVHYCDRCFGQIADLLAKVCLVAKIERAPKAVPQEEAPNVERLEKPPKAARARDGGEKAAAAR